MSLGRVAFLLVGMVPVVGAAQQPPVTAPPPTVEAPAVARPRSEFAGVWQYNDEESVDARTGKPEQSPQASMRRTLPPSATGGQPAGGARPSGGVGGGRSGGSGTASTNPMVGLNTLALLRSAFRDLLEVPVRYTIRLDDKRITFTDDLERERTYPTDGTKHDYVLGAARFSAKVSWEDAKLTKAIASGTLKMEETYFLSADGRKLFVILRVLGMAKDAPPNGVNRVYDRVE